jgi:hypothetical protein
MGKGSSFVGGLLVGFGLAAYVFGTWFWWVLHRMFFMVATSWLTVGVMLASPGLLIVLGLVLARHRKRFA